MTIADVIYVLCAATSLLAAVLLWRHYLTRRSRLLLWSCLTFVGLATNNVLVYIDLALLPDVDLSLPRTAAGAAAMLALAYALATEPSA